MRRVRTNTLVMRRVRASALRIFVKPISDWRKPLNRLSLAKTSNQLT